MLRDDVYDVILLRDRHRLNYTHGVEGLGTLLETMRRIEDFAGSRHFQQVITLGFSLSGYPALSGGRLMKAHRAISISGRYVWHPGWLYQKRETGSSIRFALPVRAGQSHLARSRPIPLAMQRTNSPSSFCRERFQVASRSRSTAKDIRFLVISITWVCCPQIAGPLDYRDEADIRTDLLSRLQQSARHVVMLEERAMQRLTLELRRIGRGAGEWLARRIRALGRTLRLN